MACETIKSSDSFADGPSPTHAPFTSNGANAVARAGVIEDLNKMLKNASSQAALFHDLTKVYHR